MRISEGRLGQSPTPTTSGWGRTSTHRSIYCNTSRDLCVNPAGIPPANQNLRYVVFFIGKPRHSPCVGLPRHIFSSNPDPTIVDNRRVVVHNTHREVTTEVFSVSQFRITWSSMYVRQPGLPPRDFQRTSSVAIVTTRIVVMACAFKARRRDAGK